LAALAGLGALATGVSTTALASDSCAGAYSFGNQGELLFSNLSLDVRLLSLCPGLGDNRPSGDNRFLHNRFFTFQMDHDILLLKRLTCLASLGSLGRLGTLGGLGRLGTRLEIGAPALRRLTGRCCLIRWGLTVDGNGFGSELYRLVYSFGFHRLPEVHSSRIHLPFADLHRFLIEGDLLGSGCLI